MNGTNICTIALEKRDLDFLAEIIYPKNKELIKEAILEDESFRANTIASDSVFERIIDKRQIVINISPNLLFEILLRRSVKKMEERIYTVERGISQKIPVFDTEEALEFIGEEGVFDYLVKMMASFIACEKETVTDVNIENLIKLGDGTPINQRFEVYKRIADNCLFVLGLCPEYVMYDYYWLFFHKKLPPKGELARTIGDYEMLGQAFYRLASKDKKATINNLDKTLELLSKKLYLAKKPLNYLSEHLAALTK